MPELSKYYQARSSQDSILEMHGIYDEHRIQEFIRLSEIKLDKLNVDLKTRKKVIHIMVEVLQNVYHHANQSCRNSINSYFVLGMDEGIFTLSSGNFMPSEEVDKFRNKIDGINQMSENELKTEYINTLDNGSFSARGGAGLGILDIVRKSGNRVSYEFGEVENSNTFFKLIIKVTS